MIGAGHVIKQQGMLIPLPSRPPVSVPRDPVAFYSERLDADHERFSAASRRATRRFGIYAVLGAALVVGFGIWGFGEETNTRNVPVWSAATARPPVPRPATTPGSAAVPTTVTVVIKPG